MRSFRYVTAGADVRSAADALIVDLGEVDPRAAGNWVLDLEREAVWVRLRAGERGDRDARAIVSRAIAGVCVEATSATELAALATVLAEAEEAAGLPVGRIAVMPRLGSAAAVLQAAEIARAPRVARLHLADASLAADLRAGPGGDGSELLLARSMVVLAGAAAKLAPPISDAGAAGGRESDCRILRGLGFGGRACTDEDQVSVANDIFADA